MPRVPPEIIVVGHVCRRKNQNAFICALDTLAKIREFRLVFVGNADRNDPYVTTFFELLRDRPWCEWAGWADREELRSHLGTATVLALTSIEDNCPMVVLEAMAGGTPVIAPNVGGVPDLVIDGVNGILCDPSRADSMAGAVQRILDNPVDARNMASAAREDAVTRFHPRHIAGQHLKIYQDVLNTAAGQ